MNTEMPKKLYHGSQFKITDGFIRAKPAHINRMQTEITAVFATSDLTHAKAYACMRLVASGWKSPRSSNTLYVQKLKSNISGKAYVYELTPDGFKRDVDGSYYCLTDKQIKNVMEIDIMQEIQSGNLKIYVLKDEFNTPDISDTQWCELLKDKNKFKLSNPNRRNLDMSILTKVLESSSNVGGK